MQPLNCSFGRVLTCHRPAQLQALNSQLQVENRIKAGAENLLQMPLEVRVLVSAMPETVLTSLVTKENLRLQVEEELEMARSKIDTIQKKIESCML